MLRHVCIAPMLRYTDRHFRYLVRLISKRVMLYTEMVTASAILHGSRQKLLAYHPLEHPLALQLGGSNPEDLAQATQMAVDYGYDEVNLNVGCPSSRVQSGQFGACLMAQPELVAECIAAMRAQVNVPITVKTRLGIDHQDTYEFLHRFVQLVSQVGCRTIIVHARKAWLKGLSPKENRTIPPLDYQRVYQVKRDFPELEIIINGGITHLSQISEHQKHVDGVMLGRAAYRDPYMLAAVDQQIYGLTHSKPSSRQEILEQYGCYMREQTNVPVSVMQRHLVTLFRGVPGAKRLRGLVSSSGI